jgi:hypothetical protein
MCFSVARRSFGNMSCQKIKACTFSVVRDDSRAAICLSQMINPLDIVFGLNTRAHPDVFSPSEFLIETLHAFWSLRQDLKPMPTCRRHR